MAKTPKDQEYFWSPEWQALSGKRMRRLSVEMSCASKT